MNEDQLQLRVNKAKLVSIQVTYLPKVKPDPVRDRLFRLHGPAPSPLHPTRVRHECSILFHILDVRGVGDDVPVQVRQLGIRAAVCH
jgi:hypothetical protein